MSSEAIRDQIADHLVTPKNAALIVIDYQPLQIASVSSRDRGELVDNIIRVAKVASTFSLPVILSTVNVRSGKNQPTIPQILNILQSASPIDRTSINAWEDLDFRAAVEGTGRKKLIVAALWTEACLSFVALDALRDGYDVYPVVDAVGGTSLEAHRAGMKRVMQAGAKPMSVVQLACELQRDWARTSTAAAFAEILFGKPAAAASH